jgi:uncharacterized RDD family membrane protein YckC
MHMQKADLTTRAVAGFVDLLIVIGLSRLPDVIGFLAASGYILIRDGLFQAQSIGKKLIGLRIVPSEDQNRTVSFRESLLRNAPLALAYLLFFVPYAGWVLCPLAVGVEALAAFGDIKGMRVGDLIARTMTVPVDLSGTAKPPQPENPTDSGPAEAQATPKGI